MLFSSLAEGSRSEGSLCARAEFPPGACSKSPCPDLAPLGDCNLRERPLRPGWGDPVQSLFPLSTHRVFPPSTTKEFLKVPSRNTVCRKAAPLFLHEIQRRSVQRAFLTRTSTEYFSVSKGIPPRH